MIKYFLIQFIRNIKKETGTVLINLLGLSMGLACALLIYLWVSDELKVDKFHVNNDRLYQATINIHRYGKIKFDQDTPGLLAQSMADELPEVEYAVPVISSDWFDNEGVISCNYKYAKADEHYIGKDYFKIFSYNLLEGNKNRLFPDLYSILISDDIAKKLFNTTNNLIGQTIEWQSSDSKFSGLFTISGVFEQPPKNSTEQFDVLFSYDLFYKKEINYSGLDKWYNAETYTFLTLKENTSVKHFNTKIAQYIKQKEPRSHYILSVRPYSDRYLFNKYENGKLVGGRIAYVKLFSTIALFILLIACINFMNLSTAKASRRFKEVGIKKSIGANRKTLITQYIGESMLLTIVALFIAIGMAYLLIPVFNAITGKELCLSPGKDFIISALGIALFTGLLAGSYPAFYISGFKPVNIIKGKFTSSLGEIFARKGLVIFQFSISVILIVFVLVVYKQTHFIQSRNLGFEKDHVIAFNREGKLVSKLNAFMSELNKIPGVEKSSFSFSNLTYDHGTTSGVIYEKWNIDKKYDFSSISVGYDFFETLGIEMAAGKSFSREMSAIGSKIIFNETAIKLMGISDPIGKVVNLWGDDMKIVGVVKDFHYESLYEELKPAFFRLIDNGEYIWVKIEAGAERATIKRIQDLFEKFNPGLPFEYRFIDDDFQALYEAENRVATLSKYFAGIAIILSCLGLFGLAAFTAQKRFKEIGIRKVHGSSEMGIIQLLSTDFIKQVLIAITIAIPVSHIIVRHWLSEFAYRIDLKWWIFAGSGLLALFVSIITIGAQSLKASHINPVICLRDE